MPYVPYDPVEPGAHHCSRENIAVTIEFLEEIEAGNAAVSDIDWRTQCGILALQLRWLIAQNDDS